MEVFFIMIILNWNVRGAAKKSLIPHTNDLVKKLQPHILIMLEANIIPGRAAVTISSMSRLFSDHALSISQVHDLLKEQLF